MSMLDCIIVQQNTAYAMRISDWSSDVVSSDLMARFVHRKSARAEQPFISVNCAAIPDNRLESELFGHEKGAFTGAVARRVGKFEEANGGTLLLDEISE